MIFAFIFGLFLGTALGILISGLLSMNRKKEPRLYFDLGEK